MHIATEFLSNRLAVPLGNSARMKFRKVSGASILVAGLIDRARPARLCGHISNDYSTKDQEKLLNLPGAGEQGGKQSSGCGTSWTADVKRLE
jgi:hypothetical protein